MVLDFEKILLIMYFSSLLLFKLKTKTKKKYIF